MTATPVLSPLFRKNRFLQNLFDSLPALIIITDAEIRVQFFNKSASRALIQSPRDFHPAVGLGNVVHCVHSKETIHGCGYSPSCKQCVIRKFAAKAIRYNKVFTQKAPMRLFQKEKIIEKHLIITAAPFHYQSKNFVLLILEDISELFHLRTMLPICANCKKIRDDQNYWESVESYFNEHLEVDFSHSICPDCVRKLYPELLKKHPGFCRIMKNSAKKELTLKRRSLK
jgi:hypothetical protein